MIFAFIFSKGKTCSFTSMGAMTCGSVSDAYTVLDGASGDVCKALCSADEDCEAVTLLQETIFGTFTSTCALSEYETYASDCWASYSEFFVKQSCSNTGKS